MDASSSPEPSRSLQVSSPAANTTTELRAARLNHNHSTEENHQQLSGRSGAWHLPRASNIGPGQAQAHCSNTSPNSDPRNSFQTRNSIQEWTTTESPSPLNSLHPSRLWHSKLAGTQTWPPQEPQTKSRPQVTELPHLPPVGSGQFWVVPDVRPISGEKPSF